MSRPNDTNPRRVVLENTSVRTSTGTSIERGEFSECTTLESFQIRESSNITSIGDWAFFECTSLQSVHLSENITSIGDRAFCLCESLQSINIPESVTSIGDFAFCYCTALQSISIPEGVTSIGGYAFLRCTSLRQRLPEGRNYHDDTVTWLRRRFNDLPIHQACYHFGNTTHQNLNHTSTLIHENRQSLAATDAMGMTALHILCCNPHATIEMVRLLVDNDHSVLSLQDVTGSTPLKLFLACRGLLGADEDNNGEESDSNDDDADTEQELFMPSLRDLLRKGIRSKDLNVALILSSDLEAEATSANPDGNTSLTPFMSAATFSESGLDVVYALAMKNLSAVVEK